jgi:hypothetical protein
LSIDLAVRGAILFCMSGIEFLCFKVLGVFLASAPARGCFAG